VAARGVIAGVVEAWVAGVVPGRIVADEDAAVDDGDLDALTGVGLPADLPPESRSTDLLRRRVHVEVIGDVRRHRTHADEAADTGGLPSRHLHGHRVENSLVSPLDTDARE